MTKTVVGALPLEMRLKFGAITLNELVSLSNRSRHALEEDIKAGRLMVKKISPGSRGTLLVPGPEAQRYLGLRDAG